MTSGPDLYAELGLTRNASVDDIKRAYRRLALQCHPDKCPGDEAAHERFQRISLAYNVLSDAQKRTYYDRMGTTEGLDISEDDYVDMFKALLVEIIGGADMIRDMLSCYTPRELARLPPFPFPKELFPPGTFPPGLRFSSKGLKGMPIQVEELIQTGDLHEVFAAMAAAGEPAPEFGGAGFGGFGGRLKDPIWAMMTPGAVAGSARHRGKPQRGARGRVGHAVVGAAAGAGRKGSAGRKDVSAESDSGDDDSYDFDDEYGSNDSDWTDVSEGELQELFDSGMAAWGNEAAAAAAGANGYAASDGEGRVGDLKREEPLEPLEAREAPQPPSSPQPPVPDAPRFRPRESHLATLAPKQGQAPRPAAPLSQKQSSRPSSSASSSSVPLAPAPAGDAGGLSLPAPLVRDWMLAARSCDLAALIGLAASEPRLLSSRGAGMGHTALHWCAAKGCVEAVEWLLGQGLDVNVRNDDGATPLHAAARNGKLEAVEALLTWRQQHTAPASARTHSGGGQPSAAPAAAASAPGTGTAVGTGATSTTAATGAAAAAGAAACDVLALDGEGRTALQLAVEFGHTAVVALLRRAATAGSTGPSEGSTGPSEGLTGEDGPSGLAAAMTAAPQAVVAPARDSNAGGGVAFPPASGLVAALAAGSPGGGEGDSPTVPGEGAGGADTNAAPAASAAGTTGQSASASSAASSTTAFAGAVSEAVEAGATAVSLAAPTSPPRAEGSGGFGAGEERPTTLVSGSTTGHPTTTGMEGDAGASPALEGGAGPLGPDQEHGGNTLGAAAQAGDCTSASAPPLPPPPPPPPQAPSPPPPPPPPQSGGASGSRSGAPLRTSESAGGGQGASGAAAANRPAGQGPGSLTLEEKAARRAALLAADEAADREAERREAEKAAAAEAAALTAGLRNREEGRTWLEAARRGDLAPLQRLLAANPRLLGYQGQGTSFAFTSHTALHWAAAKGHTAVARWLLQQGADPHIPNSAGATPLHAAASQGADDCARLLVGEAAAKTAVSDALGETPRDILMRRDTEGSGGSSASGGSGARLAAELEVLARVAALRDAPGGEAEWTPRAMRGVLVAAGINVAGLLERRELVEACWLLIAKYPPRIVPKPPSAAAGPAVPPPTTPSATTAATTTSASSDATANPAPARPTPSTSPRQAEPPPAQQQQQRQGLGVLNQDEHQDQPSAAPAPDGGGGGAPGNGGGADTAATAAKQRGNEAFSRGDYQKAVSHYTMALRLTSAPNAVLYSNRAAAYSGMSYFGKAQADAEEAIRLDPGQPKYRCRLGTALLGQRQWREAEAAFREALAIDPSYGAAKQGLTDVRAGLAAST